MANVKRSRNTLGAFLPTHGMKNTPEWETWSSMKQRCYNPKHPHFNMWGGRGITVCQEWRDGFEAFYRDMGPRPSDDHSLDRIDTNGNYEPSNCRWATVFEQNRNTRSSRFLEFLGETKTIGQWGAELGIKPQTLCARLDRGWSVEMTLRLPTQSKGFRR